MMDQSCYDLARIFLEETPQGDGDGTLYTDARANELGQILQDAIEDYLSAIEHRDEPEQDDLRKEP